MALRGLAGSSCRFLLGGSFLAVRGAGRFGWFFHMELLGGLFVGGVRFICVGTSIASEETPRGFCIPSGRSSRFGLFYVWGAVVLFSLASHDGVGGDSCGGE